MVPPSWPMDFDPSLFKKPDGDGGKALMEHMNAHHRPLMDWAIGLLPLGRERILDIGCGGGLSLELLASKYGGSHVTGVDHSADAVEVSLARNAGLVDDGRCRVLEASVSEMPFPEQSFDLVTAFETYFFWPEPVSDIGKASRLVAPGGYIAIVAELRVKPDNQDAVAEYKSVYGMTLLPDGEILGAMGTEGLETEAVHHPGGDWVIYIGRSPAV